jgi:hypothetical protein
VPWLDLVQWPAMVVTIVAAWLVASRSQRGFLGFSCEQHSVGHMGLA